MKKILPILILIVGCSPKIFRDEKKAHKHIKIAFDKSKKIVSQVTRDSFPCIDGKIKNGDSLEYKKYKASLDSIIALNKPIDTSKIYVDNYIYLTDSGKVKECEKANNKLRGIINEKENTIKNLYNKFSNQKAIHDTSKVADSAAIFLAQKDRDDKVESISKINTSLKETITKLSRKKEQNFHWALIATGLFLFCVIALILVVKFKR